MAQTLTEQLNPIFKPKSIAIIGASNTPATWGEKLMQVPSNPDSGHDISG
jgi:acyl-CoA synthetase (NDP forming)